MSRSKARATIVAAITGLIRLALGGAQRVGDPLALYEFDRESCLRGVATASPAGGDWYGDLSFAPWVDWECADGSGLSFSAYAEMEPPSADATVGVMSDSSSGILPSRIDELGAGFTLEVWLRHEWLPNKSIPLVPLVILGPPEELSTFSGCYGRQIDFMLALAGNQYLIYINNGSSCGPVIAALATAGKPSHLVVIVGPEFDTAWHRSPVIVYLDGEEIVSGLISNPRPQWGNFSGVWSPSSRLEIGTRLDASTEAWSGTLFLLALYDRLLSREEAAANFDARLAPSPLIAQSVAFEGSEDEPLLFQLPTPYSDTLDEGHPNFDPSATRVSCYYFLVSIPHRGELYDAASGKVYLEDDLYSPIADNTTLKYVPESNESSSVIEFQYIASRNLDAQSSSEVASVKISFTAQNDPPMALDHFEQVIVGTPTLLCPKAWDVDPGGGVLGLSIESVPSLGSLFSIGNDGAIDTLALGNGDLSIGNCTAYITNNSTTFLPSDTNGLVGEDAFRFKVWDGNLLSLNEASMNIEVVTGLGDRKTGQNFTGIEDEKNILGLDAKDASNLHRPLRVVISEAPKFGRILDPAVGSILHPGDTLQQRSEYPYLSGISVVYSPDEDFFSTPVPQGRIADSDLHEEAWDSFVYYAIVDKGDFNGIFSQRGPNTTVFISVSSSNDATDLECPQQGFKLRGSESSLTLDGFVVSDVDRDLDAVRVDLEVSEGFVSLNQDVIPLLDFSSSKTCFSQLEWYCRGDGVNDTYMTFVGTPSQVQIALNGLTYYRTTGDDGLVPATSMIQVTVYDGAGGACLSEGSFSLPSIRDTCFVRSCQVAIENEAGEGDSKAGFLSATASKPLSFVLFVAFFGFGLSVMICSCCLLCKCCMPSCWGLKSRSRRAGRNNASHRRRGDSVETMVTDLDSDRGNSV